MWAHGEVRGVELPWLEVSGVLHGAVAARSDPGSGAVNQRAPLCQKVVWWGEIPAFHSGKKR